MRTLLRYRGANTEAFILARLRSFPSYEDRNGRTADPRLRPRLAQPGPAEAPIPETPRPGVAEILSSSRAQPGPVDPRFEERKLKARHSPGCPESEASWS